MLWLPFDRSRVEPLQDILMVEPLSTDILHPLEQEIDEVMPSEDKIALRIHLGGHLKGQDPDLEDRRIT